MATIERTSAGLRPQEQNSRSRIEATEYIVSGVLRYGVLASLALIILGTALMIATSQTGYGQAGAQAAAWPQTLPAVVEGLLAGRPYALMIAGLLLLIATPVLRVVVSAVTFILEGDYTFAFITLFVLGVLVLSFFLGIAE